MNPSSARPLALLLGANVTESTSKGPPYKRPGLRRQSTTCRKTTLRPCWFMAMPITTVPFNQSELMEAALRKAGVPVQLIRIEGGDHGPTFPGAKNPPTTKRPW